MFSRVMVAMHVKVPVRGKFTEVVEEYPAELVLPAAVVAKPLFAGDEDQDIEMPAPASAVPFVK
jgi:hypothetical protein